MPNVANPQQIFFWGSGGRQLTPDQVTRERELADALLEQGIDYSPIGHWTQGLARVANAGVGAFRNWRADEAERSGLENARETYGPEIARLLGLEDSGTPSPVAAALVQSETPALNAANAVGQAAPTTSSYGGTQQEFIDTLMPAALEVSQQTGIDPRIIIAQAAQETGWGRSAPGNNFFGIKSHGQSGGQTLNTHEYIDGQRVNVSDSFRTYESPADSVYGYRDFLLQNPRYGDFLSAQGLDAQLEALGASGYATDPGYATSVGQIARGIALPEGGTAAPSPSPVAAALASSAPAPSSAGGGSVASLLAAASDPWAREAYGGVLDALVGQQLQQADPRYQQQLQMGDLQMQQLRRQLGTPNLMSVGGQLYNPDTGDWIAPPAGPTAPIEVGGMLLDPVTYEPIFDARNPSTTNVNGTVIDNRTGQPIYQAPQQPQYEVINGEVVWLDPQNQSATSGGQFGAPDGAREQQITRLVETGIDRNTAIGIVDGRYEIGPDETGRTRVWDLATGQTITYAQQPGGAGSPTASPPLQQGGIQTVAPTTGAPMSVAQAPVGDFLTGPAGQPSPASAQANYSTVPPNTDIGAALGLEGTVTGAVNLITDYLTGNARYENQTEAANALQNLRLQTNQALLEGFAGRTNVYTQEMIDQLAVMPGMPLSAAYDRMVQTRTLIEQQIARITNEVLNQPERWTPEDVRDATTSVGGLRGLLDTYDGVIQSLDNRRGRDAGTLPPLDTFWRE